MRTTLEIDERLFQEAMQVSGAKTKKGAVVIALKEYLRSRKKQELKNLIGGYDSFNLKLEDLERMRREDHVITLPDPQTT